MRAGFRGRPPRAAPQPRKHLDPPGIYPLHPRRPASPGARGECLEEPLQVRIGLDQVAFDPAESTRLPTASAHRSVRVRDAEPSRVPWSLLARW